MSRRLQLEDLFRIALPSDPQLAPDATAVAHVLTTVDRDSDENVSSLWLAPIAAVGGLDITIEPGELAAGMGIARRTDRYVHLYGETFIAVEAEESRHPTVTFVDGGRYLHNGRAVSWVDQ